MPDTVKTRRYHSARRVEQAEQTRLRVLDAAAMLFVRHGYEGASIAAIAEEAGVSPETVYGRFKNKRMLLGELVDRAVRGDDSAPVLEQSGPREVAFAADQHEQLRLFVADIVARLERAAPLVTIVGGASRSDPAVGDLLARLHAYRRENLRTFAVALATNGTLRIPLDDVVDTIWAITSPELHQLLRVVNGWAPGRYARWLAETLAPLLFQESKSR